MQPLRLICLLLIAAASPAAAATAIGKVDRVQGDCTGMVEGSKQALTADAAVFLDEAVTTGAGARLSVTFDDGTNLTLGENASMILDQFVYQPAGESDLHATVKGAFRYISGKLGPGATRVASVTTPAAVIGVRGTTFWGGQIDAAFGVVVLEGSVTITTPGGTTVLAAPGQGTSMASPGAAPGPVTNWPREKVNRALATVTFQ